MKIRFMLICGVTLISTVTTANENYQIEVVQQPGEPWRFHGLMVTAHDHEVRVGGRLNSRNRFVARRGHIDIAAYSPTGELISETTTAYRPGILTRRVHRRGGGRFSAKFDGAIPPGSIIKVAHHVDPLPVKAKPKHAENIAR